MAEHGKITDEGIAKLRERIGKGFAGRRPWRTEVTRDAIYHLAYAIGDLNPLYLDEDYAQEDALGDAHRAADHRAEHGHAARRRPQRAARRACPACTRSGPGSHYEWTRPLQLGDRIRAESYLKEVVEKESTFGGGRAVYQTYEAVYYDQDGEKRRHAQRHVDPHRARDDAREEEVRRHPARAVEAGGHQALPGGVPHATSGRPSATGTT